MPNLTIEDAKNINIDPKEFDKLFNYSQKDQKYYLNSDYYHRDFWIALYKNPVIKLFSLEHNYLHFNLLCEKAEREYLNCYVNEIIWEGIRKIQLKNNSFCREHVFVLLEEIRKNFKIDKMGNMFWKSRFELPNFTDAFENSLRGRYDPDPINPRFIASLIAYGNGDYGRSYVAAYYGLIYALIFKKENAYLYDAMNFTYSDKKNIKTRDIRIAAEILRSMQEQRLPDYKAMSILLNEIIELRKNYLKEGKY